MEERDEALSTFIAVTGASHEEARESLVTSAWDLQKALNTHLELSQHQHQQTTSNTAGQAQRQQQQSSVAAGLHGGHVIDLADDPMEEVSLQRRVADAAPAAPAPPSSLQTHPLQSRSSRNEREVINLDDDDDANDGNDGDRNYIEEQMLKQALEESLQTVNSGAGAAGFAGIDQVGEEHTGPSSSMVHGAPSTSRLNRDRTAGQFPMMPTRANAGTATNLGQYTTVEEGAGRMEADNHFGVVHDSPHVSHNLQRSNSYSSQEIASQDKNMVDSTMVDAQDAQNEPSSAAVEDIVLPDGVNAEEAKMLEAAMFGIPYQGPVPQAATYRDTISSSTMNPEMRAQRQIRMEQDRAFHASLRADQEKEAAKQRVETEKRRKLQEESDRKKQEQDRKEEMKTRLEAELGTEPTEPAEDIVSVMIRLPDGSRLSRKFLKQSPAKLLFHFVDYTILTEKEDIGMEPGAYKLSTQFPRKVVVATETNTLEDVGLTNRQEALFTEKI
ncbi:UBX domain-containing protein [Chloropicon primus]|nr:UBX domain-containing protein [Chloropicon primus]